MRLKSHSYKSKHFLIALLKLCIVLIAFYGIWVKLTKHPKLDFYLFLQSVSESRVLSFRNILILLALSTLNWLFEIKKWQILVGQIRNISFWKSTRESLGGLTSALLTPNRIGEYGAKAIYYSSGNRMKIVFLNFIGNMTQLVATVIFGICSLFVLRQKLDWTFPELGPYFLLISTLLAGVILILIKNFKNTSIKGYSIQRLINFVKSLKLKNLWHAQLLALIRYLIFSFQLVVLFRLFGVEYGYLHLMPIISSMYLLASILPSLVIFDIIVKGGIAVYLFGAIGISELTSLSVITMMWMLNFMIPSLLGSYFVLNFKPSQQTI